jgi:hypothetical protein
MAVAALSGLRLWTQGRRAAGLLGAASSAFLGVVAFMMPFELAIFASFDSNRSALQMLGEIFQEPWFLVAWAGLMALTLIPASLQAAALWFAVPPRQESAFEAASAGITPPPAPRPDPPSAPG